MANIGYARVSTPEQNLDLQLRALEKEECEKVFHEQVSSGKADRPQLTRALEFCRKGDVLVVWKLDRLGRNLRELIDTVTGLADRGVGFRSITEGLDTTTVGGRLLFHVFGSLAEFERDVIRERTMAGLEAARARGRHGGRKHKLDDKQVAMAARLMKGKETPVRDIAAMLGVNPATLYRYVAPNGTLRR